MKRKIEPVKCDGVCIFQPNVACAHPSACPHCGWNPDAVIRQRRVAAVMQDRSTRHNTGSVQPYS